MVNFDFKLEDEKNVRFIRVLADNKTDALLKAIKETNILDPLNVFQKQENGEFKVFNF